MPGDYRRGLTQRIINCGKGVTIRCKENLSGTLELRESTYESINLEGVQISLKMCFNPTDSREGSWFGQAEMVQICWVNRPESCQRQEVIKALRLKGGLQICGVTQVTGRQLEDGTMDGLASISRSLQNSCHKAQAAVFQRDYILAHAGADSTRYLCVCVCVRAQTHTCVYLCVYTYIYTNISIILICIYIFILLFQIPIQNNIVH